MNHPILDREGGNISIGSHDSLDSLASVASGDEIDGGPHHPRDNHRDHPVRHWIPPDDHLDKSGSSSSTTGGKSSSTGKGSSSSGGRNSPSGRNRTGGSSRTASPQSEQLSDRQNSDWTPAQVAAQVARGAKRSSLISRSSQSSAGALSAAPSSDLGNGSLSVEDTMSGLGSGPAHHRRASGTDGTNNASAAAAAAGSNRSAFGRDQSSASSLRRDSGSSTVSVAPQRNHRRSRPNFGRAPGSGLGRRQAPSDASASGGGGDSDSCTEATASASGPLRVHAAGGGGLLGLSSFRSGGGLLSSTSTSQQSQHPSQQQQQQQPQSAPTSNGLLGSGLGLGGASRYGGSLGLQLGGAARSSVGGGSRGTAAAAAAAAAPASTMSYPQHPPQQNHQEQEQQQQQQDQPQAQQQDQPQQDAMNDSSTSFALPLNDAPNRRPVPRHLHPGVGIGIGGGVARQNSESSIQSAGSDLSMASAGTNTSTSASSSMSNRGHQQIHNDHHQGQSHGHCPNAQAGSAYLSRLLASKQRQQNQRQTQQQQQQRGNHSSSSLSGSLGLGLGLGLDTGGTTSSTAAAANATSSGPRMGNLPAFGRGLAAASFKASAGAAPSSGGCDRGDRGDQQKEPVRAGDLFKAFEDDVLGGRRRKATTHGGSSPLGINRRGSATSTGSSDLAVPSSATAGLNAASSMGSSSSTLLALRHRASNATGSAGSAPAIGQPGSTFATNTPAASAGTFQRRRPRKPTSAYTYFFREKCKELAQNDQYDEYASSGWKPGKRSSTTAAASPSSMSAAAVAAAAAASSADGAENTSTTTATMSVAAAPAAHSAMKRRKSDSGESIDATPRPKAVYEEDLGKVVAQMWRTMSTLEKAKYEDMADRDAERYQEEIEEYYKGSNGALAACMINGRAGGHLILRISADTANGAAAAQGGGRNSVFPRAVTAESMSDLVTSNSNTTSSIASASNPRKTALQQMLAAKRTELLNDIGSLNQISSSRAAAGKPVMQQSADVRQRLYNLAVGPASSAAAGPSNWNRARLAASGVVTPTDSSPRTSIGGLATGAAAPGVGLSSSLPTAFAGPSFGRRSSSTNVNDLAGRYMSRKSEVTIEHLDDSSISSINSNAGSLASQGRMGGSSQRSLLAQALEGKLNTNSSMEPKI